MSFDQILLKSDQIFNIYVNNHQMHVENFQGRHFPEKKKALRECQHIAQGYQLKLIKSLEMHLNLLKTINNL